MEISEFAFKILVLFFPGIICASIVHVLTVQESSLKLSFFLLKSFVFGIASYSFYWLGLVVTHHFFPSISQTLSFTTCFSQHDKSTIFYLASPINDSLNALKKYCGDVGTNIFDWGEILRVTIVSIFLGGLISKGIQSKWLTRLATKLRISEKYGDENLFTYFLNAKEVTWVTVRDFKNKISYLGLRTAFSENDNIREIVLSDVTVYSLEDSAKLYDAPVVYLSYEIGELIIELADTQPKGEER